MFEEYEEQQALEEAKTAASHPLTIHRRTHTHTNKHTHTQMRARPNTLLLSMEMISTTNEGHL